MSLKRIEIEQAGPIEHVEILFEEREGKPIPTVIVGPNGSGKSILLSYIVNSLIVGKQEIYTDSEVEKGKVYKYRSPKYIRSGTDYSYACIEFNSGEKVEEWQLSTERGKFEENLKYTSIRKSWNEIPKTETSLFKSDFNATRESTKEFFQESCCLYFPVNRFEEPGWLNITNLNNRATYTEHKRIAGYSNRDIVCDSTLKANISWLLDLILDRQAFEQNIVQIPVTISGHEVELKTFQGFQGRCNDLFQAVTKVITSVLNLDSSNVSLGIGSRGDRQISVSKDRKLLVSNLFQLSTGETQLLNLIRH